MLLSSLQHCFRQYRIRPRHISYSIRNQIPNKVHYPRALHQVPILEALRRHDPQSTAVIHSASGRTFTYGSLFQDVTEAAERLRSEHDHQDLAGERIAILVENGYDYVVNLLAAFASNAVAVPLSVQFPTHELQHIILDSQSRFLVCSQRFKHVAEAVLHANALSVMVRPKLMVLDKLVEDHSNFTMDGIQGPVTDRSGLMLYTSGTTSRPKGVMLPQSALTAQAQSLLEAWRYSRHDRLLHVLPLHHIHGVVNALLVPFFAGSSVEFLFPFNGDSVWRRLAKPFMHGEAAARQTSMGVLPRANTHVPITFLTCVPTIYETLLRSFSHQTEAIQVAARQALNESVLRLNISGSAALPASTRQAWETLTSGNTLLERYGMTEVGMALSCGLDHEDRIEGSVGWPLPSVQCRLVDLDTGDVIEQGQELDALGKERQGEIQLRGPTIFSSYWRNPTATEKEFVESDDGGRKWFKTGDVAIRRSVPGAGRGRSGPWAQGKAYFVQGRRSADIIKVGGEKVSALEVERELLSLPEVSECAVVALPSDTWGQKVAAIVVLQPNSQASTHGGQAWSILQMRRALGTRLARFKLPQEMKLVEKIPRNAMGKINKKTLVSELWG